MDRKIKIAIADDHPIVREGMQAMFETSGHFEVVQLFESGDKVVDWCWMHGLPDVILTDVRMPGVGGFKLLEKLLAAFPDAKVLMLAGLPNEEEALRAQTIGAKGYVAKTMDTLDLAKVVARIAEGAGDFISDFAPQVKSPFSPRELETLRYLALGKTRDEIAIITGCSSETIKGRISDIRHKMDASNTTSAVARAYELGYI